MLRTRLAILALVPAFAIGFAACAGEVDTEPETEEAESAFVIDEGVVVGSQDLLGTYRDWRPEVGQMRLFVLMGDGTYHRVVRNDCHLIYCGPGQDSGTWRLWRDDRETFLSLFPGAGRWEVYGTALADGNLYLTGGEGEQVLVKTDQAAWCDEPVDCALQDLPGRPTHCVGSWQCNRHVCEAACSVVVPGK